MIGIILQIKMDSFSLETNKGISVWVDFEDFCSFSPYSWYVNSRGYIAASIKDESGKFKCKLLHRLIMGEPNAQVDHIDGNKLDCRRVNLRVATRVENLCNQSLGKRNTLGFKGILWNKRLGKFQAQVCKEGKRHYLGAFPSAKLAAEAYDKAAIEVHGEFARTNKALGLL